MSARHALQQKGFTLLEVLVALAIIGLGMVAVFSQLNQSLLAASRLRDKTLASWIALDRITELRVRKAFPKVGESSDEIEMANMNWSYTIKTVPLTDTIRRLDVSVSFADTPGYVLTTVSGFVGQQDTLSTSSAAAGWPLMDENLSEGVVQ
jgi:general secretion pathway protein I